MAEASPPALSRPVLQRIRLAAEVAAAGATVQFRVNPTDPRTLVWFLASKPTVQHVILNAFGNILPWEVAVQAEFERIVTELQKAGAHAAG